MSASTPGVVPSSDVRRLAGVLAGLCLAGHLPTVARRLWDHDSVQFALGVKRFDLAAHHPHPPGYPLYIGLLKLLAKVGVDPLWGMVALSLAASAVGTAAMVLLVAELSRNRRAAALGGVLYAFNPILWFYGSLPLVYALEGAGAVTLAWSVAGMRRNPALGILASGVWAFLGGLRPSSLVLLLPLLLYGWGSAWWGRRVRTRHGVLGLGVAAAVGLVWGIPLLALAGGVESYRRLSGEHFGALLPQTSVLFGAGAEALLHNLEVLVKWALQGVFPGAAIVFVLWLTAPSRVLPGLRAVVPWRGFLAAWVLPPVLFFALFHITKAGYTLVFLPAFLVALGLVASPALSGWRGAAALLGVAVVGTSIFLFGTRRLPHEPRVWALVGQEFNHSRIRTYEEELDRVRQIVESQPPHKTMLVTVEVAGEGGAGARGYVYSWHRHLQWYLPSYPIRFLALGQGESFAAQGPDPWRRGGTDVVVPAGVEKVLFVLAGPVPGDPGGKPPLFAGRDFYLTEADFVSGMKVGEFRLLSPSPW